MNWLMTVRDFGYENVPFFGLPVFRSSRFSFFNLTVPATRQLYRRRFVCASGMARICVDTPLDGIDDLCMTIAASYLCSEGVVFGADSTATFAHVAGERGQHYNHMQKIYEIGEQANLAIVQWGRGGLGKISYRTLLARLADRFRGAPPKTVSDAAWQWSVLVWDEHAKLMAPVKNRIQELLAKGGGLSDEEKKELAGHRESAEAGFCIGGVCDVNRTPEAYEVWIGRDWDKPEQPKALPFGFPMFWGWGSVTERLRWGMDGVVLKKIMDSGKWTGTQDELLGLLADEFLFPPGEVPIREAIDWVYSSIQSTIKAYKFSRKMPACGGPIEVAVITTDRQFRWVKHKQLDSAIQW